MALYQHSVCYSANDNDSIHTNVVSNVVLESHRRVSLVSDDVFLDVDHVTTPSCENWRENVRNLFQKD
jgi:hypothetical protein